MPKIVDHEKQRLEIVEKAAPIFSENGFTGLGMRQIADHLGISKSALYHYFASKEDLFAACTVFVVGRDEKRATTVEIEKPLSPEEAAEKLVAVLGEIEKNFQGEMYLLMDYMRGKSSREVARDKNMKLANAKYLSMIAHYVGEEAAPRILSLALGSLLQRLLDGRKTKMSHIEKWIVAALRQP